MAQKSPITYAQSGVDIKAGDAFVDDLAPYAHQTRRTGSLDGIGGFGGLFDLKAIGKKDPVLVAGCDGVGSKLDIAFALNVYDTIGYDLVAMCVNDLICQNAETLFFLDYLAVNKLDPVQNLEMIKGISAACIEAGCQLIGGETAELPSLYATGKFDLAGFAVGAVERDEILPRLDAIRPGDRLIGIASSGTHSNGYSLLQRVLKEAGLTLDRDLPGTGHNIGELMLEPTRIYVKPALEAANFVKAYAHITGGGLLGNIKRVLPKGMGIALNTTVVPAPDLCNFAIKDGWVEAEEAYRVWNMGIGLVAVVEDDGEVIGKFGEPFARAGFGVYDLGRLTEGAEKSLQDDKFDLKVSE